jgi:RHS repeat-associated protein
MMRGQTFSPRRWETDAQWGGVRRCRNRAYDPGSGCWLQENPIGVAGGINLNEYNGNDPVTWRDPFGLCPVPMRYCPPGFLINGTSSCRLRLVWPQAGAAGGL